MSFMYYGGKSKIANKLITYFPEHTLYVEVFGGSAELLFRKKPARAEVYNDIDKGLCAIFQCLFDSKLKQQLFELLETYPPSRDFFEYLKESKSKDIIKKAFRKLYLLRFSFNANCRNFAAFQAVDFNYPRLKGFDLKVLEQISKRKIIIENQDFRRLIPRFDKPHSLIYLDPPYYEILNRYEHGFEPQDHLDLFQKIQSLKHATWILSYNDHEVIRDWYQDYHIIEETWDYLIPFTSKEERKKTELVISNRPFVEWNIYNQFDSKLDSFLDFTGVESET